MATFGNDIVEQALKKSGILGQGRAASAVEGVDALADLNDMLSQWNTQRLMVWNMVDVGFTSTGANSYTVGPGGNFNVTPRPDRIEAAYQRQLIVGSQSVDSPIRIIPAYEDYARIGVKSLVSFGTSAFLDTASPMATLYVYPSPQASIYQIHLVMKNVMPIIALDTDLSTMPPHYLPAMKFALARRLRQAHGRGMKPDPELNRLSNDAIDVVRNSNIQVPILVMPRAVLPHSGRGYNILSDQGA